MRKAPTTLSVLLAAACGAPPTSEPSSTSAEADVAVLVTARLDSLEAITSLYAKHLPSGREVAVRADRPMNTLSVIKIPVMVQAYRDDRSGRLDLDERVTVGASDMRRGSGLLQTFAPGLRPTLRDLVRQMVITSDNTATDIVIGRVELDRVNEMLRSEGYRETSLRATTGDLFRAVWTRADSAHASLSDREVFERGFPTDPEAAARSFVFEGDSTAWLGRTTARETGALLEQLYRGALGDGEATAEMLDMLRGQFYDSRLPRFVRFDDVRVAHKTGDWPPIAGNDVGILYHDDGPSIVAVFTNQNRGDFYRLEETLGRIAQDLVAAWK